jgi:chemotaxis response regulator CheB
MSTRALVLIRTLPCRVLDLNFDGWCRQYWLSEEKFMEKATRILVANRPKLMRDVVLATLSDQPGIEIVGEVSDETQILGQVQATLPDLLVIGLDEPEQRPAICDVVLRDYPGLRILAIASRRDRSICYWASFDIHSDDVEASTDGILNAARNAPPHSTGKAL